MTFFDPSTIQQSAIDAAKRDAQSKFPNESCGLIVGGSYVPCTNVSTTPDKNFIINTTETQPYILNNTLQAVIHSHTTTLLNAMSTPSADDMTSQIAMGVPWGVIDLDAQTVRDPYWWGDFILDQELIGQEFQHGINDCYSLCRKYYWQKLQVKIPEFPRDDMWWVDSDLDMYKDGFAKAGFTKISRQELQDGDAMLGKIKSTKINHAGIYLSNQVDGQGVVLHHIYGRLSRREPAGPYLNRAELFLRYTGVT